MLYVVMLGGRHPGAKIEVHDVVFALADTFEQAYPQLRQAWFGSPKGLHIDSWLEVHGVDGQRIELRPHAPAPVRCACTSSNLGGYEREVFGEAHRYLLVTAHSKPRPRPWASNACRRTG